MITIYFITPLNTIIEWECDSIDRDDHWYSAKWAYTCYLNNDQKLDLISKYSCLRSDNKSKTDLLLKIIKREVFILILMFS